jgi:TctA family transporter
VNNATADIWITVVFTVFGIMLVKFNCEPAPMVLGYVLGPLMEQNLRRSMIISGGDPMIFVTRPISLTLLLMAAGIVLLVVLPQFRKTREVAFQE